MPLEIVAKALDQIYSKGELDALDVLWLTGEPLVLGVEYFRRAVELCVSKSPRGIKPAFIVQTNGTLINEEWCDFFLEHEFVVGVSVDGPSSIHDSQRRTRLGQASFPKVERAIQLLTARGVKGGAICVITKETLRLPPELLFDFFHSRRIAWSYILEASVGENNGSSTALTLVDLPAVEHYLERLMELWAEHPESYVRDFEQTSRRIFGGAQPRPDADNLGCLDILNICANGDFYWGNPELMAAVSGPLAGVRFSLANSHVWDSRSAPPFVAYQSEVHRGVQKCRDVCAYFEGCQGGNPAHKFYEFGSFDVAVHTSCRLNDQVIQSLMTRKMAVSP